MGLSDEKLVIGDKMLLHGLWAEWLCHRSPASRNALAAQYYPWLHQVAGRLYRQFRYALADFSDYVNLGAMGLISAIEHYKPGMNVPFEAYAYHRVRGAILNGLVSYSSEIAKSAEGCAGGEAFMSELAREGEDADPLITVVDAAIGLAFGRFLELGVLNAEDVQDPQWIYQKERESLDAWALVEKLPERERFVVTEHYRRLRAFKEIAVDLGVSTPRVSQLHYQALKRLRTIYESL